ncbi:TPA: hypothetical protein ACHYXJ_RS15385, partial [Escherichia coli]
MFLVFVYSFVPSRLLRKQIAIQLLLYIQ